MDWAFWIYVIGALVTMGAGIAVVVKDDGEIEFAGLLLCGLIWPALWAGVAFYALLDKK